MKIDFSTPVKIFTIRLNILRYGDLTCEYCSKKLSPEEVVFDHIWPRKRGGGGNKENCAVSCERCNHWKLDKTYGEFIDQMKKSSRGQNIIEQAQKHKDLQSDISQKKLQAMEIFYKNFNVEEKCGSCDLFPKKSRGPFGIKTKYCRSGRDMSKSKNCGYYRHCDKETDCRS